MSNKYLNKTYTNKQGLNYKIVHYNTYYDITRLFDSGYIKSATMKEVKRNAIKDKLSPSVYGVGIVGIRYQTKVDGKHTTEYGTWKNMLRRCYSEKVDINSNRMTTALFLKTLKNTAIFMSGLTNKLVSTVLMIWETYFN